MKLTLLEEEALWLSLQYHILPNKVFEDSIEVNFEKLPHTLQTQNAVPLNEKLKAQINYYF